MVKAVEVRVLSWAPPPSRLCVEEVSVDKGLRETRFHPFPFRRAVSLPARTAAATPDIRVSQAIVAAHVFERSVTLPSADEDTAATIRDDASPR